jgi:hypothetical protein
MNALFLGTGFFGKGVAPGPWFMGDFKFGVWAGGSASVSTGYTNPSLPSMNTTEFGATKSGTIRDWGMPCSMVNHILPSDTAPSYVANHSADC